MIFVDRISLFSILWLLPLSVYYRVSKMCPLRFRFFFSSPKATRLLGLFSGLRLMSGEEADYDLNNMTYPDGALATSVVQQLDPLDFGHNVRRAEFEQSPMLALLSRRFDRERLLLYLEKALDAEIRWTLVRINVVAWLEREESLGLRAKSVFYLARTPWHRHLKEYAKEHNVELRGYRTLSFPHMLPWSRIRRLGLTLARRSAKFPGSRKAQSLPQETSARKPSFTVAVPSTGRGLSLDPRQNSDLFWALNAGLSPDQLLVYAIRAEEPVDDARHQVLQDNGIRAVAMGNRPHTGSSVPVWPRPTHIGNLVGQLRREWKFLISLIVRSLAIRGRDRWIAAKFFAFTSQYHTWRWFFSCYNVKVHVDPNHGYPHKLALDQAIADLGGLSMGWQESYEAFPNIYSAGTVDIHFSFSAVWLESERQSRSIIPQMVFNGYVHDHAFPYAKDNAAQLRDELTRNGAQFVICYLDENSLDDRRFGPSNESRSEDYRYLLDKLLSNPDIGLILKPKKVVSLRRRLGGISTLLEMALATGRCYLHETGNTVRSDITPCEAGAAADVTIGILSASTAALECALSGASTLLIDRESVTYHPSYKLGEGRVVFRDWDRLWEALEANRRIPGSVPGLGDWSPTIDSLDSFRDGKAAERMGQYINWVCQSLARGATRDQAMQYARGQYVELWGKDKVATLIRDVPTPPQPVKDLIVQGYQEAIKRL